ncbi:hypothetical protein C7C46_13305 [Streptomyces tateyamensis]|uniref:Uncharacterized protein n=1 Tax=Streptomyces tateyamensis TaxID=565073 RepID=A0A2V4P9Y5_9ACTN|nr:hypothetical protein [Streptomyces tateyamensis]PYC80257.1 hypothetical protein C7C46_13305 [Streptomyces tateyamensis]
MTPYGEEWLSRLTGRSRRKALERAVLLGAAAGWTPSLLLAAGIALMAGQFDGPSPGRAVRAFVDLSAVSMWGAGLGALAGACLGLTFAASARRRTEKSRRRLLVAAVGLAVVAQYVGYAVWYQSVVPLLLGALVLGPAALLARLGSGWAVRPLQRTEPVDLPLP